MCLEIELTLYDVTNTGYLLILYTLQRCAHVRVATRADPRRPATGA